MKKSMLKNGFILAISIIFVFSSVIPSTIGTIEKQTTFTNSKSGAYIQGLIDNASAGDTIYIPSGIYYENIIINKSISLIGEDKNTTIIDGGGSGYVVYLSADWVNLSRFSIQNGYSGFKIQTNHTIIADTRIVDNKFEGVIISDSNHNTFRDNTISHNGYYQGEGIGVYNSNNNIISGNYISNNGRWDNVGLRIVDSKNNLISDNIFDKDGFLIRGEYENSIANNTINGKPLVYLLDKSDIIIDNAGQVILINCDNITIQNQKFFSIVIGIDLQYSHNCFILNNTISSNSMQGIYLHDANNNTISNNTIQNNNYEGIHLGGFHNSITDNIINHNSYGIRISSDNNIIIGNIISSNYAGIFSWITHNNIISGNTITNNDDGIRFEGTSHVRGNNNTIIGNIISSNDEDGIDLSYYSNNTIMGNTVTDNEQGMDLYQSEGSIIINNTISNNQYNGFQLYRSSKNLLKNNNMQNNNPNFMVEGYTLEEFYNDIDSSNIVNGKPVYYWTDTENAMIPVNVGYIVLVNCTNILVKNTTITNEYQGIMLIKTQKSTIAGNIFSHNSYGINLRMNSEDNTLTSNIITNGSYGILLEDSSNNTITGNNILMNNHSGISLYASHGNIIMSNTILKNLGGLNLDNSNNNIISKNNFIKNIPHVFFQTYSREDLLWRRNQWHQNYWNRPRVLPKVLIGILWVPGHVPPGFPQPPTPFPWPCFDFRPALKPYDIN